MILLLSYDVRRRGGIERLSLQVWNCLQQRGVDVHLLCTQRLGRGALGRRLGQLWFLLQLVWWLPRASQVLSMHVLLLRPIRWLRILQQRSQTVHCWLHGIEVWGASLYEVKEDLISCQGLIASSNFTRDRILEMSGSWPPIAVLNPMADLVDGTQEPDHLPPDLSMLTVARMDAKECYKGHLLILQSLHKLLESGSLPQKWQWRVVGDGDGRQALEEETERLGLVQWVRFLGCVSDDDLRQEFRSCSLLVMPSAYSIEPDGRACGEGFGIVYLEAAQAGRGSIACRQGGQTDLIEDGKTGWLVDADPISLATLLSKLGADQLQLARVGANARNKAQANFNRRRFIDQIHINLLTKTT